VDSSSFLTIEKESHTLEVVFVAVLMLVQSLAGIYGNLVSIVSKVEYRTKTDCFSRSLIGSMQTNHLVY
jgi:hypothetical protein